jgi:hypothetical protein
LDTRELRRQSTNQAVKIAAVITNDTEENIREKSLHDVKLRIVLEHLSRLYFDTFRKQEDFFTDDKVNDLDFKREYECDWVGESEIYKK